MTTTPATDPTAERRVVALAAAGTLITLVAFTAPLATLGATGDAVGAGVEGRTWILSSMSIGLTAALLPAGAVADDLGRRRTFVLGLLVQALTAIVCVVAPTTLVFVLARVAQGVGGAATVAASLGMIAHVVPAGPRRAAASGVWGAALGGGIAAGPLLAAAGDRWLRWWAVYVVLAVAAVVVGVLATRLVAESRTHAPRGLDLAGGTLLAGGVSALLAALVEGRRDPTAPTVLALAALAILLLVGFVVVERTSRAPMLDLALLRHPPFLAATVGGLANGAGPIALMAFLGIFSEQALGVTPLAAALLLLCWSGTSIVFSLLARRLPASWSGRHQLAAGLAVVGVGLLMLGWLSTSSGSGRLVPGLLVAGVASGVLNAALGREAVASVPDGRGSMGSGANNTARYLGSAVGVTVVAVVVAAHGSTPTDLVAGWNTAVLVVAGFAFAGAVVVALARPRRASTMQGVTPSTR